MPDTLIEAELFGYAEGAFTGARRGGAKGLVVEADGGTLFLDEIGDMPVQLQSILLRLLDDWTIRPVGGATRRTVDVQLVAATNANLEEAVQAGRFRADLLYRLNTIEITLPPLAECKDFSRIARHLLRTIDPAAAITNAAVTLLAQRPWPGNVRELRSVYRLAISASGAVIRTEHLNGSSPLPAPPTGSTLERAIVDQVGRLGTVRPKYHRNRPPPGRHSKHRLQKTSADSRVEQSLIGPLRSQNRGQYANRSRRSGKAKRH